MRELTEKEIQQVSGAGRITDLINSALDAPARQIGSSLGAFAGKLAAQGFQIAASAVGELCKFVSGIFGR